MTNRDKRGARACAQCGEVMHLPEWSEYLNQTSIRHLWKCEGCGYTFETIVRLAIEAEAVEAAA
jgi:hypothetical protein